MSICGKATSTCSVPVLHWVYRLKPRPINSESVRRITSTTGRWLIGSREKIFSTLSGVGWSAVRVSCLPLWKWPKEDNRIAAWPLRCQHIPYVTHKAYTVPRFTYKFRRVGYSSTFDFTPIDLVVWIFGRSHQHVVGDSVKPVWKVWTLPTEV